MIYLLDNLGLLYQARNFNNIQRIDNITISFKKIYSNGEDTYLLDFEGNIYICLYNNGSHIINSIKLDDHPSNIINLYVFGDSVSKNVIIIFDIDKNCYIYVNNNKLKVFHNVTANFILYNDKCTSSAGFLLVIDDVFYLIQLCNSFVKATVLDNSVKHIYRYYYDDSNQNFQQLQKININEQFLATRNNIIITKTSCNNQYVYTIGTNITITSAININHIMAGCNNLLYGTTSDNNKYIIDIDNKIIIPHPNLSLKKYYIQLPLKKYNKNPNNTHRCN
jgi:hypothetical protein